MESIAQWVINVAGFTAIMLVNLADMVIQKSVLSEYLIYALPFAILIIFQLFFRGSKGNATVFLALAVLTQIAADRGNYSAAVFVMFAVAENRSTRFLIISSISMLGAIFINFVSHDYTIADYTNLLILYALIGIVYYRNWYPKPWRPKPHPEFKPIQLKIIRLLSQGLTYKEIASELPDADISAEGVSSSIRAMRKKLGPGTTTLALVIDLYSNGYIT